MEELQAIQEQIIHLCRPQKILLFGSQAKGTATSKSDIDLCVIASTENKRALLTDLYCDTESNIPIDFLLTHQRSGSSVWRIAKALRTS